MGIGGLGFPVLLAPGLWVVAPLIAAVGLLWIGTRLARAADGPTLCGRCWYSVRGLADEAACPECGAPAAERTLVRRARAVRASAFWIAGAWTLAAGLVLVGPVTVSSFSDQHLRRVAERIDLPDGESYREVVVLTPGYDVVWGDGTPTGSRRLLRVRHALPVYAYRSLGSRTVRPTMWIDPGGGGWTLRWPGGEETAGEAIDAETVLKLFEANGVDASRAGVREDAPAVAAWLRWIADGRASSPPAETEAARLGRWGHVPVGSRHPNHPWWWLLLAVGVGGLLHRRGPFERGATGGGRAAR